MGRGRGRRHGVRTAAALVMAAVIFTGCTPSPAPSPSPTGFASDEEAFAAAEATYRAYIDAVNAVVIDDPDTFAPLFELSAGEQNAFDRQRLSSYHANGYEMSGQTIIISITRARWIKRSVDADLLSCVDVSSVDVRDRTGDSIVEADRPDQQSLKVSLVVQEGRFRVTSIQGAAAGAACTA